jgi:hypothetical protein
MEYDISARIIKIEIYANVRVAIKVHIYVNTQTS